jgi:hypothetical protein
MEVGQAERDRVQLEIYAYHACQVILMAFPPSAFATKYKLTFKYFEIHSLSRRSIGSSLQNKHFTNRNVNLPSILT